MIEYDMDLLPYNEKTRSGIKLERKTGLCIHYAGNPGQSYLQLREFFENLDHRYASYHWVIDQQGGVHQLIPTDECAWHGGPTDHTRPEITELLGGRPNWSTEGVCFLHNDGAGTPTDETRSALVRLVAWRASEEGIRYIHRHHDYTGKDCPRYYVHNRLEWLRLKNDISSLVAAYDDMKGGVHG